MTPARSRDLNFLGFLPEQGACVSELHFSAEKRERKRLVAVRTLCALGSCLFLCNLDLININSALYERERAAQTIDFFLAARGCSLFSCSLHKSHVALSP